MGMIKARSLKEAREKPLLIPVGLEPDGQHATIDVEEANRLLRNKKAKLYIDIANGWAWNLLEKPASFGLKDFDKITLPILQHFFSSAEEYLQRGYEKWRGGYGVHIATQTALPKHPRLALIEKRQEYGADYGSTYYRFVDIDTEQEISFWKDSPAYLCGHYCVDRTIMPCHIDLTVGYSHDPCSEQNLWA